MTHSAAPNVEQHSIEFDPNKVPTQTMLVELLQFILHRVRNRRVWPLAVIVSAWDIVEKENPDTLPEQWFIEKLPLLYQFVQANPEYFNCRIYGVSGQGGELKDQDTKNALTRIDQPSKRIIVRDKDKRNHDITAPIKWLMNNE